MRTLIDEYRRYLQKIDLAFAAAQSQMPDCIPCRRGCSMCCSAFFAVRWCDCALMAEGILASQADQRNGVIDRCRDVVWKLGDMGGVSKSFRIESVGWNRFERFIEGAFLRCPVLTDDGACSIHEFRPRICRLAGTIFRDPGSGTELDDFCEIAAEARRNPMFTPPEFPLDESLLRVIEFDDVMRRLAGEDVSAGFTIPAAGILEYLDTQSNRPRSVGVDQPD